MKNVLGQLESCYDKLAENLSQATVAPDSIDESLALFTRQQVMAKEITGLLFFHIASCVVFLRKKRSSVQALFVTCTKLDVSMCALMQRTRSFSQQMEL